MEFALARLKFALPLLALSLAGCGDGSSLIQVEGKVTLDGAPLTKGSVRFAPDKEKGNTSPAEPVGEVGADGSYKLMTNGKAGAPLGWYKISVNGAGSEIPDSGKPFANKSPVAAKYLDPAKSGLSVEVVGAPAVGAYDLKVTAK